MISQKVETEGDHDTHLEGSGNKFKPGDPFLSSRYRVVLLLHNVSSYAERVAIRVSDPVHFRHVKIELISINWTESFLQLLDVVTVKHPFVCCEKFQQSHHVIQLRLVALKSEEGTTSISLRDRLSAKFILDSLRLSTN